MPVADTFFILPGSNGRDAAVMIQMMEDDGSPHPLDPRSILQSVVCTLGGRDIFPVIAPELEFYLIGMANDDRGMGQTAVVGNLGRPQETNQIYGIDSYDEFRPVLEQIKSACHAVAVGADTAITEYGRGQFEINLMHRDDPVRACDEAALLRHLARRVARQHGVDVTFMGKPLPKIRGQAFTCMPVSGTKRGQTCCGSQKAASHGIIRRWLSPQVGWPDTLAKAGSLLSQCQCLAADTAWPLRADRPQLGLQQPDSDLPYSTGGCQGKTA